MPINPELAGRSMEIGQEAINAARTVGEFVSTQAVNVLSAGGRILDWYLQMAANSPVLAQITQWATEHSKVLTPALAVASGGRDFDWVEVATAAGIGAAIGAVFGTLSLTWHVDAWERLKGNPRIIPDTVFGFAGAGAIGVGAIDGVAQLLV